MEDHEDSSKDQSALGSPVSLVEGYSRDGLTLTTLLASTEKESATDKSPDIDVIHVMVVGKEEERLTLESLLLESVASRRRELVFRCGMARLLAGELTSQAIDGLARQLLSSLLFFLKHDEQHSKRALVFVAYDFGDLIVKKAISIAGANDQRWPGIFTSAAQFIFFGCFHRANNPQLLYSKVLDYLVSQRDSSWGQYLIPASINSLAECIVETTDAFVASKITLRSQVISLYADLNGKGKMSDMFDSSTAILGVPNEITFQEQKQKDKKPFPELPETICSSVNSWVPHKSWIPFEQTLLAITSTPRLLSSTCLVDSHPVFKSTEHERWMASAGARILYVCGDDYNGVIEAAEQIFFCWKLKMRQHWGNGEFLPISFVFSAHDPTRCSIKDVISSLLVSYFSGITIGENGPNPSLMKNQFLLQHAWTEMDLFKILELFARTVVGEKMLLLLQNIDECDKSSRDAFWAMLSAFATTTEVRFKVVITSRGSLNLDLLDELRRWPDIPVDTWTLADHKDDLNEAPANEYPSGLISTFCPGGLGDTGIRRKLEELRPMKKENLDMILRLIGDATNWPQELSAKALRGFCSRLQAVTLATTPADVLGNVLRDIADQDGLCWILKWLFMGRRPLSYRELAMVLCHCKRGEAQSFQTPSHADVEDSLSKLGVWLRGITESSSGQVRIREDVRGFLQNELSHIWAESTSPDAITTFLLDYLTAPDIQRRLDSMNKRYQSRVQSSGKAITPPLTSDGQDFVFYAIQALPYHLSENPAIIKSIGDVLMADNGKLAAWSKAFWAMSNPFSRPESGTLNSPYETLLALGKLKSESVAVLHEINASAKSPDIDSLSSALREGNEDVALSIAQELISASIRQDQGSKDTAALVNSSKIPWPQSFLWRAVWLNMVRLATLLLNDGMDPDPDPADGTPPFFPSPLYMAARLCHAHIMDVLIERGANIHAKRYGKYKAIQTAASHSNIHGVKSLVAKDASLLESQEPETPLYFAALEGCWHMAKTLLELGADPNSGVGERPNERWAPLVVAAEANHIKTARILLEHGADPNICGPNDLDTPLWFAAIKAASADMVQLLLDKGADPNHELLQPPLLMELMEASLSTEGKLAILEVLVRHSPPIQVNVADRKRMTPLLYAAEAGELSIVTWLLEHEADVNATDKRGRGALHCAIKSGHVEVVRELLKWKPQLNNLTTSGLPLVELAVQDVAMMRMLLDAGADIELANAKNHTALNIAVDLKKAAVVKLLVERKADMHHVGKNGWNAITIAASNPAGPEILRVLVEAGADLRCAHPQTRNTPLHYVTSHGAQLARILLEFRTSLDLEQRNNEAKTPLLSACTAKNAECAKLLIRAGADVNAEDRLGWTPLSLSARVSLAADAVDMLFDHPDIKIDAISKIMGTALMVACRSLNLEMVSKLLAHGADANILVQGISYDNTALKCACIPWSSTYSENKDNTAGIVDKLIAHGADVNASGGSTIYNAICAASFSADASIINLLLDKGASAQDPDPLGRLPIHFAAANGVENFEAVAFAHRGDPLVCDRAGKNALHWAAQFGNAKTIEAIVRLLDSSSRDKKEYIDQPDIDGWTPLCWTTRGMHKRLGPDRGSEPRDYIQTVKLLIELGANRLVKFTIGTGEKVETFTPVQMARLCGVQGEVIDMLETNPDGSSTNATAGKSSGANKQSKQYKTKTAFCDICLHTIFGYSYQCQTCVDFDACKKCYSRIHLYHNLDGDEQHPFAFRKGYDQEFEDLPTPDSPVPDVENQEDPAIKEAEHFNDGDGDGDGDGDAVVDELQNEVQNEADDLALGGLDDLDELVAEDDPATPP